MTGSLSDPPERPDFAIDPDEALAAIRRGAHATDALIASTGFTGRALYALGDDVSQMYMVGSMGCASSLGLGMALARPERRVIVIEGDGALIMRMGALTTVGAYGPPHLIHVVLDNGIHESTGGQATVSNATDLLGVAASCGYGDVRRITSPDQLDAAVRDPARGLRLLHVHTMPRTSRDLPRPTIRPDEVAMRLRSWATQPVPEMEREDTNLDAHAEAIEQAITTEAGRGEGRSW